jgi:PhnB protein
MAGNAKPIPQGFEGATPYMICKDAARALEFYQKAFDAKVNLRLDRPDGRLGHAEFSIGRATLMLSEECAEMGAKSPETLGGSPVSLYVYVDDVDAFVGHAAEFGAKLVRPPTDMFYGDRSAHMVDPFGHSWGFATHIEDVPPDELQRRAAAMFAGMNKPSA